MNPQVSNVRRRSGLNRGPSQVTSTCTSAPPPAPSTAPAPPPNNTSTRRGRAQAAIRPVPGSPRLRHRALRIAPFLMNAEPHSGWIRSNPMGLTVVPGQCPDDTVTFAVTALVCQDRPAGQPGVPTPGTGAFVADGDSSTFARHAISALCTPVLTYSDSVCAVYNGQSATQGWCPGSRSPYRMAWLPVTHGAREAVRLWLLL